jgi:GTPase SAR1 family protein
MQALFELTEGKKKLEAIIKTFPSDSSYWNEAQNRFHFVDRLLTECLGWQKPDIAVEESDESGGRSDYLLGRPPKAALEAKREAKFFDIPPTGSAKVVRKLKPLLQASKAFAEAVHQVIPYCALHGAQIAIVCNGPQLAIFQTMIPGQSPLEGECYFFNGFDSYLGHFPLLWKLLSPEGITENRAYRDLSLHRNPRMPPKASTAIAEPLKYRYRNDFQENLRSLSSLLLEEIEDNPNLKSAFYKECYVPIEANNRHLLLSKKIIASRYRRVGDDGISPSNVKTIAAIDDAGDLAIDDPSVAGVSRSRPVVVIGDVGVGKTSFFEKFFQSLDSDEKADTYFIHINLGIKANLSHDVKVYVISEIPAILKDKYSVDIDAAAFANAIYHKNLVDFDLSVDGSLKGVDEKAYLQKRIAFLSEKVSQRDRHLQASLGHLVHGRKKHIILVLDNADQRTFDVQQETFLIAQELAASRNLLVFVALRPSTFYLSKTTGALSAYQNKILTIAPPPADEVIQKRLIFAARVAEGKVAPAALSGIRLHLGSVVSFIHATLRSLRDNEAIRQFLSNITGGNTRGVIELITGFFGSPNVDSRKIVQIEENSHSYKIPLHEFTKHALLGEYAYYNSQSSLVACNVFDVSTADSREHFLSSLLVAFLSSNSGVLDQDGFLTGQQLLKEMARLGFVEEQTRHVLRRLAKMRLIETPHAHYREIQVDDHEPPEQFHFRATSIGIYHIRYWSGSFAFLDAVSTDTPIFDEDARAAVCECASSFEIDKRYLKANTFRKYLETQWHLANFVTNYYDFVSLVKSQDDSFTSVAHAVERTARPRS